MRRKRALSFTFITDDRFLSEQFGEAILKQLLAMDWELKNSLHNQPVDIFSNNLRKVVFDDNHQYRINYIIKKTGKITWDKVMEIVNSIQAPFYKFI